MAQSKKCIFYYRIAKVNFNAIIKFIESHYSILNQYEQFYLTQIQSL